VLTFVEGCECLVFLNVSKEEPGCIEANHVNVCCISLRVVMENNTGQAWWSTPVIPAVSGWRQEHVSSKPA
jgi:hypothetical protein